MTFDKINENLSYYTTMLFYFNKPESKKIIDDFISGIKTESWELPFEVWDLEVWKNLVEEPDFEFSE